MCKQLLSLGLDVGTTTTQLILSRLEVENRAGAFSVPEMAITSRQILYRSPVHFTPLLEGELVDAVALRQLVDAEYEKAGIRKEQVDTGAVIITGETSRKENAAAVLASLAGFAGDFVAATAGPHLESVLAAKGAGAVDYSQRTGKRVLHMDIGGGTTNLALIEGGRIVRTGCMNVGGRLIRQDRGIVTYVSPVVSKLCPIRPGEPVKAETLKDLAVLLTQGLEMAAGLRPAGALAQQLSTREAGELWQRPEGVEMISFSGGVADCIEGGRPGQYGDMGVELGQAIRESRLCAGGYMLGEETIRATVIGAGSHSAQLSGSTVFCRGVTLPRKNLPAVLFTRQEQESDALPTLIARRLAQLDTDGVLVFPGYPEGGYERIAKLAEAIAKGVSGQIFVCVEADMAKALGQKLSLLQPERPCLCIDRIFLGEESYLDIGKPVGPALPVVVKTLILGR